MKLLLLNQYYAPDIASTAQHAADFARAMVEQGHEVTVLAGRRGYADLRVNYAAADRLDGVRVIRAGGTGLGKGSRWRRAIDFATFLSACAWRMWRMGGFDAVVTMTTPPMLSVLAILMRRLTGGSVHVWLMDMNPDEAVAAGWLRRGGLAARTLEALHRYSLRRAERIVVMDRFMQRRVEEKGISAERVVVVPPWSHDSVYWDTGGRDTFRRRHGIESKFVVMYSGNHSACHPLDPVLEAARRLRGCADLVFCFIGGGSGFGKVQAFARAHRLDNVLCLPYQPLVALRASLSAADLHVVVMGDAMVGIVHPCKIYNIMALGIPVLYTGPAQSHIGDLGACEWLLDARGGDTDGIVSRILEAHRRGARRYEDERRRAEEFTQSRQLARLVRAIAQTDSALSTTAIAQSEDPCLLS